MTGSPAGDESDVDETPRARREAVRERYGDIADSDDVPPGERSDGAGCCGDSATDSSSCCSGTDVDDRGRTLGYSDGDLASAPDGANLGLGCGNPKALADLEAGETVLDLGSGGGFDCFLAAEEVGEEGRVVGVDMTPEMVERARANAEQHPTDNVEFRLGEIEHLPVPDANVDVVVSNCVVNLSPDKEQVFEEAFRVLRPGGRLAISDLVATPEGRDALDGADADPAGCASGAATADELREMLARAGFRSVSVRPKDDSEQVIREMYGEGDREGALYSGVVEGVKPPE